MNKDTSHINDNIKGLSASNERCWVNHRAKVPYMPSGQNAKPNDPTTWSTYAEVVATQDSFDGIGIVFTGKLLGIDIDHCIVDGNVSAEIAEFIEQAHTYTEISPSGTGLHLYLPLTEALVLEAKKSPRIEDSGFECYTSGRYFTVTGNEWEKSYPLRTVTPDEALNILRLIGYPWSKQKRSEEKKNISMKGISLEDEEVIKRMFSAKNGTAIKSLYDGDISVYGNDDSTADAALCSHLAFWTGKNPPQIERLWLASPLGQREKTTGRKDYRKRTIDFAVSNCKEIYKGNDLDQDITTEDESAEKESQASRLLKLIQSRKDIIIFRDSHSDPFVALEVDGIRQIWSCKGKQFKQWLSFLYWKTYDKNLSSEAKRGVIGTIESLATFEKEIIPLQTRNAFHNGDIWYDLTNNKWQAIKITPTSWELVEKPPILFRRYVYNRAQMMPIAGGNVRLLLKYFNISDPQQQLLILVHIICLFIPDFAHPILLVHGHQGSAKTTFSKLLRRVIDPSVMETASMPETHRELVQVIAHNSFLFFDNVSWISNSVSDLLAKAVTGSSFPKRELYSDDDDIVYTFRRGLGINGINMVVMRPDLLERSIILKLDHISPENRKLEKQLMLEFENDLPNILGGIFDVLVKALALESNIKQPELPRMADFSRWGCAVAEAMGVTQKEFLDAYNTNIALQTEIVVNENLVASTLIAFMQSKGYKEWTGTASGLLTAMSDYAKDHHMDTYDRQWPKSHNSLSRKINELKVNLFEAGWSVVTGEGQTRKITVRWVGENEPEVPPADEFTDF